MKKLIFLILLCFSSVFANPYEDIKVDEQLNLFTNYFLNETLTAKLPNLPVRGKARDYEYNYQPTKYELYYNYVQRLKAIKDSLRQEQKELDEKYTADIYKYNQKLKKLFTFYKKEKNIYPIIADSFNKAFKVVYGKPYLSIKSSKRGLEFYINSQPLYKDNRFEPLPIEFNYADEKRLFGFYERCEVSSTFIYENSFIYFDEVVCSYKDKIYQGKINSQTSKKIKLNIKINDDIFQQILLEDKDK